MGDRQKFKNDEFEIFHGSANSTDFIVMTQTDLRKTQTYLRRTQAEIN